LDFYYGALKSQNCGGDTVKVYNKTDNKLDTGTQWDNDADKKKCNWHNDISGTAGNARDIVDKAYNLTKTFLDAYLDAKGESDKAKRKTAGEKLKTDYNVTGSSEEEKNKKKLYDH